MDDTRRKLLACFGTAAASLVLAPLMHGRERSAATLAVTSGGVLALVVDGDPLLVDGEPLWISSDGQ